MAKNWDVFVSHASEDKASVASPLANALSRLGLRVWLDRSELTLGDSLAVKIDEGLSKCQFGVVILSESYFNKFWTLTEFSALMAKQEYQKTILPVLHKMQHQDLVDKSPLLAGLIHA